MRTKAIFFDAAGTLIKPARRVGESYAAVAGKYGLEVAPAELANRFRSCFDASPPLAFPGAGDARLAALERAWWKDLVLRVFEPWRPFERFDDYFSELFEYFAGSEAWALYPEVLETLTALKQRGLILDVISNFDSRLIRILAGLGASHWFDQIFVSTRVGYAKPDRRIFEAALREHGIAPQEAVHVGDSWINDVRGARDAGLHAVFVDRGTEGTLTSSPRVSSLNEIVSLLDD
jgi:putative hydrolase of the HAD superfamily